MSWGEGGTLALLETFSTQYMFMKNINSFRFGVLVALALFVGAETVSAQGTAFTYQGRLETNGTPVNGFYDFQFSLYNAATGGTQVGSTITQTAIGVTNGLFTTSLNFGSVFTGNATWLSISVRTNNVGTYDALTPLQSLAPTPYAIYAENVPANPLIGDPGTQNFFAGLNAGNSSSPGTFNTAVGFAALDVNTGSYNSALGNDSLAANTTGAANTAGGVFTLWKNTTGGNNTAFGADAMAYNIGGSQNTAVGQGALENNTNGSDNVALGALAMNVGVGASDDTALGYEALQNVTTGFQDTATGYGAMAALTTGSFNTATGTGALSQSISDTYNAAFGGDALAFDNGGSYNTALGASALAFNSTGNYNTGVGYAALILNGGGNNNTAVGYEAAYGATGPSAANTAIGGLALYGITTGYNNTAAGYESLQANSTGADNVSIGVATLQAASTSAQNTALGTYAFQYMTAGTGNIGVGISAGNNLNTGSNNIYIGNGGGGNENNIIRLGTPGLQTETFFAGNLNAPGGSIVDSADGDNGTFNAAWSLSFGGAAPYTGEGMGSCRAGGHNDSSGLDFYTDFTKRLVIQNGGNIGIGTDNPSSLLDVIGNITCQSITITSDRNAKENFTAISAGEVLAKVAALPLTKWNYKKEGKNQQHIGPMAQDFQAAFGLNGGDDKHISMSDEGGVALAAIQGLNAEMKDKDAKIQELSQTVSELRKMVEQLEQKVASPKAQ